MRSLLAIFLLSMIAVSAAGTQASAQSLSGTCPAERVVANFTSDQFGAAGVFYGLDESGACTSSFPAFGAAAGVFETSFGLFGNFGTDNRSATCVGGSIDIPYGETRSCTFNWINNGFQYEATFSASATLSDNGDGTFAFQADFGESTFSRTAIAPAPTITLSAPATATGPFDVTLTSDQDIDDASVASTDLTVTGPVGTSATVGMPVRISARSYTFPVTPSSFFSSSRSFSIQIAADAIETSAGVSNTLASNEIFVEFDDVRPRPLFYGGDFVGGPASHVVGLSGGELILSFNEPVTGFTVDDLITTNVTASNLQLVSGSDREYSFNIVASGDGPANVSLPGGVAQDALGNTNSARSTSGDGIFLTAVASRPEVTFVGASDGIDDGRLYEFAVTRPGGGDVFPGPSSGLSEIEITNGLVLTSTFTRSTGALSLLVTPSGGDITIGFPAEFFQDEASGNLSEAVDPIFVESVDLISPTPTISFEGYDLENTFTARITWDEGVTGFDGSDITPVGATLGAFVSVSGSEYTVEVTAIDLSTAPSINLAAGVAEDLAGNPSLAAIGVPPAADGVAPVLTITGVPDGFTGPITATLTFDWGERVLGFEDGDIAVTGGTLGPITGGPQSWTAQLSVDGTSDVSVTVAANAVLDTSGTPSTAASVTGAFASGAVAEELIREFLASRASALIAAQPGLAGLLDDTAPSGNISVTRGAGIVQLRTGSEGPVWAALDAQWSDIDGFETTYTHLTFGSHMYLQDQTLLGVMVQLDHAASTEEVAEIEGTGWLVGPYYVARYGNVVVDARLLWGRTDNEISPLGTYTDTFATERVLAMVNLSGEIEAGRATLHPLLGWAYVDDRSEAYVDALSNPVAAQRVRLSEIEAALDWSVPVGTLGTEFTGGIAGILTSESGGNGSLDGGRGRVDFGLRRQGSGRLGFDIGIYADGLFQPGLERYGMDLSVDWRF